MLRVYSLTVDITSLFALFIGMFIIYNTLAIAVTQRRTEIGILRALGTTRSEILSLFLFESAIAGFIGSAVGVASGIALAIVVSGYVSQILQALYGVVSLPDHVVISKSLVAGAMIMGVLTSIVAAIIPARNAAGVDPVKALQRGRQQMLSARSGLVRLIAAGASALAALAFTLAGRTGRFFFPGYICFLLAALLLTPGLSVWITRLLRPLLKALLPVEGSLAADSLIQAPRRTSPTVAALMFSIGLIISLGGISRSSYNSVAD